MLPTCPDPWRIPPELSLKYEEQFLKLKPIGGFITGDQARGLFLQSGLPHPILAHIWGLADINADGKMDRHEFSIAMHLIQYKLKGGELPKTLPPGLQQITLGAAVPPAVPPLPASPLLMSGGSSMIQSSAAPQPSSVNLMSSYGKPASPIDAKLRRSGSVSSQDGLPPSVLTEWAIPQASKLRYTQAFNSQDRTRSGFLSGAQARSILMQSALPQPVLAQIWNLSDVDGDGRLSCEEFVVCMFLIDMVRTGDPLPSNLPPELVPPSLRRKRSASIQPGTTSQVSLLGDLLGSDPKEDDKLKNFTTFEDKRKENFEKGQAELERRRLALLESQRKEKEERERKEREEQEKREKIRLEQEKKRQIELEKQLAKQREIEQEKEDQRRKALEQREAARKEMERQRQLEWEKQRHSELLSQRQKEQETVCHLKNKSKNLSFKLGQLDGEVTEITQKVTETRQSVTDIKSSIDNMRIERDSKLQVLNSLKKNMKELNNRLLLLNQEKMNMSTNVHSQSTQSPSFNLLMNDFNNKQITLHQLKNSLSNIEKDVEQKKQDLDTNNNLLKGLKDELAVLVTSQDDLYHVYEEKRQLILNLKNKNKTQAWQDPSVAWEETSNWKDDSSSWPTTDQPETAADWTETPVAPADSDLEALKYKVLYRFDARNEDELSIMPGDIVLIAENPSSEPGWLKGELQGKSGWFPESYVEGISEGPSDSVTIVGTEMKRPLEEIAEDPEIIPDSFQFSENSSFTQIQAKEESMEAIPEEKEPVSEPLIVQAVFPWTAKKENHLTFNKGDIIVVKEQQDIWWYGEFQDQLGWFPQSYVKPVGEQPLDEPLDGEYHVAAFTYQSEESGDLSFQQGELILVTAKDGDWWTGLLNSKSGFFPSNYVLPAEPVVKAEEPIVTKKEVVLPEKTENKEVVLPEKTENVSKKKPDIVTVIADYEASGPEQLSLKKGQLIQVRKKTQSGWWEGLMQAKGQKRQLGWFPASYVKALSSSAANSNRSTPDPIKGMESPETDKVIAIYPFEGQQPDELAFDKGQVISVLNRDDASWWQGEFDGKVGLFPRSYVKAHHSCEKKRLIYIEELITTEERYMDDLLIVMDEFYTPFVNKNVLTNEELKIIFVNWKELIFSNTKMLQAFRVRKRMSPQDNIEMIGDILCENLPSLTPYIRYCSCQLNSAALLQNKTTSSPEFKNVAKECCQAPATKGMPLSSFLLKPMQRITKYPLIIKNILDNTASDHPDYNYTEEALKIAEKLCNQVNEGVREKENSDRLEWIQAHIQGDVLERITFNSLTNCLGPRKLLHSGTLIKVKSNKELAGFLFNDFLLLTEPQKDIGKVQNIFTSEKALNCNFNVYRRPIFLNSIHFNSEQDDIVQFSHCNREYFFKAYNNKELNHWLKKITAATALYIETECQKALQCSLKAQLKLGIGRLLVIVCKGVNLKASSGKSNPYCELRIGSQENRTQVVPNSINPCWNASMQFFINDLSQEVLCISIFDRELFSPNGFLGRTEVRISNIYEMSQKSAEPITQQLPLYEVEHGEIVLKFDLQLFHN